MSTLSSQDRIVMDRYSFLILEEYWISTRAATRRAFSGCTLVLTCLVFDDHRAYSFWRLADSGSIDSFHSEFILSTLCEIFNSKFQFFHIAPVALSPGFFLSPGRVPGKTLNKIVSDRGAPIIFWWFPRQVYCVLCYQANLEFNWRVRRIFKNSKRKY